MSDVGTILERGVRGATPPPDPFERMLRRRDRKHRNQRIVAGVVGIAVFVAAIVIVATGGRIDRSLTPAGTGPTEAPDDGHPIGLIGLPPESATPSSPSTGELVLGFMFGHTMGDPGRFNVDVYADGRLIWQRLGDPPTGLIEQHLTPDGVELLRSEALSTGLFDHDLHLISAYGLYFGEVKVLSGDRLVRVTWGDIGPNDVAETTATSEQVNALKQLDARLEDLSSWLPASACGPGDAGVRAVQVLGLLRDGAGGRARRHPGHAPATGRGPAPHV